MPSRQHVNERAADVFMRGVSRSISTNTTVTVNRDNPDGEQRKLKLHGHVIAQYDQLAGTKINFCGYPTRVTMDRLNELVRQLTSRYLTPFNIRQRILTLFGVPILDDAWVYVYPTFRYADDTPRDRALAKLRQGLMLARAEEVLRVQRLAYTRLLNDEQGSVRGNDLTCPVLFGLHTPQEVFDTVNEVIAARPRILPKAGKGENYDNLF